MASIQVISLRKSYAVESINKVFKNRNQFHVNVRILSREICK